MNGERRLEAGDLNLPPKVNLATWIGTFFSGRLLITLPSTCSFLKLRSQPRAHWAEGLPVPLTCVFPPSKRFLRPAAASSPPPPLPPPNMTSGAPCEEQRARGPRASCGRSRPAAAAAAHAAASNCPPPSPPLAPPAPRRSICLDGLPAPGGPAVHGERERPGPGLLAAGARPERQRRGEGCRRRSRCDIVAAGGEQAQGPVQALPAVRLSALKQPAPGCSMGAIGCDVNAPLPTVLATPQA